MGPPEHRKEFLAAVFAARETLSNWAADFADALGDILVKFDNQIEITEALDIWLSMNRG